MLVLGIDSSSISCSCAILKDGELISEVYLNTGKKHSEQLLPVIDKTLKNAKLKVSDLDLIAITVGPGSFTGLRIGVSTAKALAQAADKKIVGVSTLDALAYKVENFNGIIVPILNAKKNEFYSATYRQEGSLDKIEAEYTIGPEKLMEKLKGLPQDICFLGDGVEVFKSQIQEALGDKAKFLRNTDIYIEARHVAALGKEKLEAGIEDDYYNLKPFYIRKSEAETTWEAKNGGKKVFS